LISGKISASPLPNRPFKITIPADSDNQVADMQIWKVGSAHHAAIISIVPHFAKSPDHYKNLLAEFKELSHITVEVNQCLDLYSPGSDFA
jgi:Co/Zn/Cd efflux system component